ncbi:uncharacterized protein THITE_2108200 [Thermothielavioides terrestris NRRL 8126]|uniref:DUF6590 domain-containing protein n=1 Tax=Thermothielavioides terrestris (strain ATCC 38088 / NRRL 8126) TaxID=578455 RepID=G2QXX2_THETT|nr:uncharacterized protein THITE_2108200 [Thermothielavioides terrestris NRRL 8126]AEO63240.1 hypothetical protein THITE_2108200 [Thermothielavioides terrestris NRRL 8126]
MDPRRDHRSEWSDWVWDEAQARYWRARRDAQGNIQYQFNYNLDHPAQTAPRSNVDDLANSLSNVDLGGQDTQYTHDGAYTYGAPVAVGGDASAGAAYYPPSAQPKGKGKATEPSGKSRSRHHQHRQTGKGKSSSSRRPRPRQGRDFDEDYNDDPAASDYVHDPFYSISAAAPSPGFEEPSASSSAAFSPPQAHYEPEFGDTPRDSTYAPGVSPNSETGNFYGQENTSRHDADPESVEDTRRRASHGYASGDPGMDEHDSSYYPTGNAVPEAGPSDQLDDAISQANPYMTGALATDHGYSYSTYEADGGRATPRPFVQQATAEPSASDYQYQTSPYAGLPASPVLENNNGFVVEPSSKFQPGSVFKIVWYEPLGSSSRRSDVMTNQVRMEQNGHQVYQGIRRFIVVANDEGHCSCVPILTYEHKACTKRGVKPLKHGIVYQVGKKPRMVEGEPQLGFPPIAVELYEKTERLVKESRVNYAKITTVEHNFKVLFIGRVNDYDFENIVVPAVDYCWQKKQRKSHQ